MKQAYFRYIYLRDNVEVKNETIKMDLEYKGKSNCFDVYLIKKVDRPGFLSGEIYHDLKLNNISLAYSGKGLTNPEIITYTAILNKSGKIWRGFRIFTSERKDQSSGAEFWFAK